MKKRTVILVDGQNLFYGLKDLSIMEKDIQWDAFFQSLLESQDELIRTYWFRPQKILDSYYTANNIRNYFAFKKHRQYANDYINSKEKVPPNVLEDIERNAVIVEEWIKKQRIQFSQIEYNYDQLSLEYGDIEVVKTGVVKINPYNKDYLGEKGVDIALAVKMISLSVENKCDKIILISGDFDYAEAIRFVKNNMTKIHIVKLHKGVPPKNKSVSRDLAILADKVIDVYESDLKTNYLKK